MHVCVSCAACALIGRAGRVHRHRILEGDGGGRSVEAHVQALRQLPHQCALHDAGKGENPRSYQLWSFVSAVSPEE